MHIKPKVLSLLLMLFLFLSFAFAYQPTGSVDELYTFENLAKLRSDTVCKMFSSYDRTGGNDDGFTGAYSKLREENGNSVIAEMQGAGCIQRIWFTHSIMTADGLLDRKSEHIMIYLDGTEKPVIDVPLEKLFSGELDQFPKPLVGASLGGFYSYVPIPYNNGCKVVIQGNGVKYYQVTYNEFSHPGKQKTFAMEMTPEKKLMLDKAVAVWSHPGDISMLGISNSIEKVYPLNIKPDKPAVIELEKGPKLIRAIYLESADSKPLSMLNGKISIYWDNTATPAVETPLDYFFGQAFHPEPYQSLIMGNKDGNWYTFFPMPYKQSAKLVISSQTAFKGTIKIVYQNLDNSKNEYAYFHTNYYQELPTEFGLFYSWLNTTGKGHYVGILLATEGNQNEPTWLEGDEIFTVDGGIAMHGTGTEDYFNCGWYAVKNRLDNPGAFPIHGFPIYRKENGMMRAVAYRWHLTDPVVYQHSINAKIEHGGINDTKADYRSTVFFYDTNPAQVISKIELPIGEDCVNYLQERIWQLASGNLDTAQRKLDQLYSIATEKETKILIDGLEGYLKGLKNSDLSALQELGNKINLINDISKSASDKEKIIIAKIIRILERAKVDLEQQVVLKQGLKPGDAVILESRDRWGQVTPLPLYQESTDFRSSSAKVDDLHLFGKGSRFTYGNVTPSFAKFTPQFPQDGYYRVESIFSYGGNASNIKHYIYHTLGVDTVILDQRGRPGTLRRNNDRWNSLGIYQFQKGQDLDKGSVVIDCSPGIDKSNSEFEFRAYADAVRFVYITPDVIQYQGDTIDNFESGDLRNWMNSTGTLYPQPVKATRRGLNYHQQGEYFVGTAETGGNQIRDYDDSLAGELKSKPFVIKKNYLNFLIGGGDNNDNLYIALIRAADDYIIHKATGNDSELMERRYWEVSDYLGTLCYLKIVDNAKGAWGHINLDDIQSSDSKPLEKYIPAVIAGEFRRIYNPSIGEKENWYINDHCFIYGKDSVWHLFGITHPEPANPIDEDNFAHAISPELNYFPWEKEPFALSVVEDPWKEIHLWAPYVLLANDTYYMFYCAGDKDPTKYKIHLATSPDLWTWTRHPDNPVVSDGYHARDPFVLRVNDKWVIYYTATSEPKGGNHVVAYRTSDDLVHWSDRKIAYTDPSVGKGGGPTESPFVVHRGDYYYLFIGPRGGYAGTDIFRSKNPFEFKIESQVGHIASHAAEVVRDLDGNWYVSHCGWGEGGVYLAPLYWND